MKKIILAIALNISLISCNSQEKIDKTMNTEERISAITDKIKYFDLRFGNLCNLSCRSCNPTASSQIAKEINK